MNTAFARILPHSHARRIARVVVGLVALASISTPAFAQLSRVGNNPLLFGATTRGTDSAYDPVNRVYLNVSAYGSVYGVFSNTNGDPVSSLLINSTTGFAHYPRVVYSPHVRNGAGGFGGFLVSWHENLGSSNFVNFRIVAYPDRLVTAQRVIPSGATWWESGASMAYSPTSQVFLVAFRTVDYLIWGARIGTSGEMVGAPFQISQSGIGARDPNVAWNSSWNQFGVLYTGFQNAGATAGISIVDPAGNVLRHNIFNFTKATYISDLRYNAATNRYVAVWFQGGTYGAELSAAGDVIAAGLVSTTTGTYDGLGLAYNPVSGTFLLAGQGPSADVWGAELNARGARTSADQPITAAGGSGAFYPRPSARTDAPHWNLTFGHSFTAMRGQVVATSSANGGPAGSLGDVVAPPPPSGGGTSTPTGCPGTAPFPGAVCVNGGWVPGTTAGDTSTGGCPGTAPFAGAVCVKGGWVAGTGGTGGTSTGGCPGTAPFAGAVCVNGGWVPGTGGSGSTSTGGCPGTAPFAGAVCVNGGWVPGTGGTSTGGCPGTAPFAGAVCVNGGWVPGTGSTAASGGCTTPDPFAAIGGGTCVNGGWTPGRTSTATSSCTTPSPGAGWVCSNGGWTPPTSGSTSSCTSVSPGAGWICSNGGWLPPGSGSISTCGTTSPGTGWVCVNGGWLPPGSTGIAADTGGCTTPDPFTAMGGGVCVNGGWKPKSALLP